MEIITEELEYSTRGETDIIDITDELQEVISKSKIKDGQTTVFVPGSTAALTTVEYEKGLIKDLKTLFDRLVPRNTRYAHDDTWHDGNGYSHVRSSLLGASLTIPFKGSKLILGTWQQVILVDFDNRPRRRRLIVQILGARD